MSVTRAHAERIAALARLRFSHDELSRLTEELNHILEHVEALKSVEEVPQLEAEPEPEVSSTRGVGAEDPDGLRVGLERLAPDWQDGFFVVPPLPGLHEGEGVG